LSSLKRPVHTPRPSEIILLDVEKNNKMQEVDVREPTKDNHTGEHHFAGGNQIGISIRFC